MQAGHATAQLVERQQILLIGGQQTVHALADTDQGAIQFSFTTACRAVRPGRVEPAVDLLADQGGVLQQAQDFGPDQVVQQILADRPVIAGWSGQMAVVVRSQAAVIVDLPRTRPGRGAIQRVAALAARPCSRVGSTVRRAEVRLLRSSSSSASAKLSSVTMAGTAISIQRSRGTSCWALLRAAKPPRRRRVMRWRGARCVL